MSGPRLCLDYLTVAEASPADQARIAAANDCRLISIKICGAAPASPEDSLLSDTPARRELRSALSDLGVEIDMLESFNLTPEADLEAFRAPFEAGAGLGARKANVLVRDDEPGRLADRFGRLCDLAGEYDIAVFIEISRRMACKTAAEGAAFLERSGVPGARLLIDSLHWFRNGLTAADLAGGGDRVGRLQLSDGPAAAPPVELQLEEALRDRLPPGEGALPLAALVAAAPKDVVVGLEAPMDGLKAQGIGPAERAARVFAATRRLMAGAG
jgi:sugar phosphate isomerase/epimerase